MFVRWLRMLKISWVLTRHGLYELFFMLPFFRFFKFLKPIGHLLNAHKNESLPVRVRLALESLGPTFVKLGQALSTRNDLLDIEYIDELVKLQDRVPPFPSQKAIAIIEASLKQKLSTVFLEFEEEPMAAASIAQVHGAVLYDGSRVVVKVVRPNIGVTISRDIKVMEIFAHVIDKHLKDGKRLRAKEVVAEYARTITNELDLTLEASNGAQLKRNFEGSDKLYIPEIYWELTRKNIMVMERISGVSIDQVQTLKELGVDIPLLAERSVEMFFTQVFVHSFFHADMHPGNIFVDVTNPADPTYIALDYGIIGTLNENDQHYLASNFLAFFNRDYRRVAELHVESGWVPADASINDLETAIRSLCEPIFNKPLKDISFGSFLLSLFQIGQRFQMVVQPQLILLQKTLFAIEGVGRNLYPELDLWKTAKPFLVDFVKEKSGPKATAKKYLRGLPVWIDKAPDLIQDAHLLVRKILKGEVEFKRSKEEIEEIRDIHQDQTRRKILAGIGGVFLFGFLYRVESEFNYLTIACLLLAISLIVLALREKR